MNDTYKDMLHLPYPVANNRPRMSMQDRAAQFSPFAALTGYEDALREEARLTDRFIELEEDRKQEIDRQIQDIKEHLPDGITARITYFVPDPKKDGGSYGTVEGQITKIDETAKSIRIGGITIPADRIFQIDFA